MTIYEQLTEHMRQAEYTITITEKELIDAMKESAFICKDSRFWTSDDAKRLLIGKLLLDKLEAKIKGVNDNGNL